jgi:hypothetical protein
MFYYIEMHLLAYYIQLNICCFLNGMLYSTITAPIKIKKNTEERDHLEDSDVDGRIIL